MSDTATETKAVAQPSSPAAPLKPTKQYDVSIIDHADSSVTHWPAVRVTVDESESLVEKAQALELYRELSGVRDTTLRWSVVEADGPAPQLPAEWLAHWHHETGAPYFQSLAKKHAAVGKRAADKDATEEHKSEGARVARLRSDLAAAGLVTK